jgi:uncharacterized membrane protein
MLRGEPTMLAIIGTVLIVLWLLGMVTSYTMGGFIHLLLILALISIVFHFFSGRSATA